MTYTVWADPPAGTIDIDIVGHARQRSAALDAIADTLRLQPGRWARVGHIVAATSAARPWLRRGLDVVVERLPDLAGDYVDVYARAPIVG